MTRNNIVCDLVNALKEERKRLKMTQQELADRMGVSRLTVARWERDGGPLVQVVQWAFALNKTPRITFFT